MKQNLDDSNLCRRADLGENLSKIQAIFHTEKQNKNSIYYGQQWEEFCTTQIGFCRKLVNDHIRLHQVCKQYTQIRNLRVSFRWFRDRLSAIEKLLTNDLTYAATWQ